MPFQARVASLALAVAALATAGWLVLRGSSPDDRYKEQVARVCAESERSIRESNVGGFGNTYFENVVMISVVKMNGLAKIDPPPERRKLHAYLLSAERRLERDAEAVAQGSREVQIAAFPQLRSEQNALEAWYRTIGIKSCSD